MDDFRHIHLNVLQTYRAMYPDLVLGLSDHTPQHATVLGAVALGARAIRKHFTDDNQRQGPDHPFSMTPATWREMVDRTREAGLGNGGAADGAWRRTTSGTLWWLQRRCIRARGDLQSGLVLDRQHLAVLRPALAEAIQPYELEHLLGRRLRVDVAAGKALEWTFLEP